MEICPCCKTSIPLGLFEERPSLPLPLPIMSQVGLLNIEYDQGQGWAKWGDRFWIEISASLPIDWPTSPVGLDIWIECPLDYQKRLDKGEMFEGYGWLASDFPGVIGSIGSMVKFKREEDQPFLIWISDPRIQQFQNLKNHSELVSYYQMIWGNSEGTIPADGTLRKEFEREWKGWIQRSCYKRIIKPPPPIAGIDPAYLLVAPPVDTGEDAISVTVGCAEAMDAGKIEIAVWWKDPGNDFFDSFAEFAYSSRLSHISLIPGNLVIDQVIIPQTNTMTAWLLAHPWWVDNPPLFSDNKISVLAAIPVYIDEQELALSQGSSEELLKLLESSGYDMSDPNRQSVA